MMNRLRRGATRLAFVLLWMQPLGLASGQELSARELKKVVKQADKAFETGRYSEAIGFFDQILTSTSSADPQRGDALYASALIRLSADSGHQDIAMARKHLDELAELPASPRWLAVPTLRSLFGQLDTARAEVDRSASALEAKAAAYQAEREQAEAAREEAAGESEAAGDRVRALESQLRKLRAELSECQSELEAKEEALQKLRDALVGGS